MPSQASPAPRPIDGGFNLVGQRLGRKGQETRERILCAALQLLAEPGDAPVTLTGVARTASVGMTTLYLYFPDLGELVLAALLRVWDRAEGAFVERLRIRWPDDRLTEYCLDFLRGHLRFWQDHARILHLRNSFANASDLRFLRHRNTISRPLLDLLVRQMDGERRQAASINLATVLLSGFEGLAGVLTNANWDATAADFAIADSSAHIEQLLRAEAQMMALAIASRRAIRSSAIPAGSRSE